MNALRDNAFTHFLGALAPSLRSPRAILAVSAHWERAPIAVTASPHPVTIHDFWGFPEELHRLRYPAPGSPALAALAIELLAVAGFEPDVDPERGLDHGTWAPLLRLLPAADVPVVQLSLPADLPLSRLPEIGMALAPLRDEGVLVLGSGNLVHNLRSVDFHDERAPVAAWAREFDAWAAERLREGDRDALSSPWERQPHGRLAHPTLEHYAPLLVVLGAAGDGAVSFPFEGFEHGTISLRCVRFSG
jgi:4,5-DOPA dioxygenase extradiol